MEVVPWTKKIAPARDTDHVIGITSKNPGVILGDAQFEWHNKYLTDEFGTTIKELSYKAGLEKVIQICLVDKSQSILDILNLSDSADIFTRFDILIKDKTVTFKLGDQMINNSDKNYKIFYDKLVTIFSIASPIEIKKINPAYDPNLKYIPRSDRPEWIAIGMVGMIPVKEETPGCCTGYEYCGCRNGLAIPATSSKDGWVILERVSAGLIKILFK